MESRNNFGHAVIASIRANVSEVKGYEAISSGGKGDCFIAVLLAMTEFAPVEEVVI